jgi:DNA anti-recombination protein RmuC
MSDFNFQFTTDISLLSLVLLLALIASTIKIARLSGQYNAMSKSLNQLKNEFRAINSGQLGMGRKIRQVVQEIANAGTNETQTYASSEKAYQQAGLLLSRGATIEEVVEACDIAPAEAELIAIMNHAAPSIEQNKSQTQAA